MSTRDEDESRLLSVVSNVLRSWLAKAKDAVLRPYHQYRLSPSPMGVQQVRGAWESDLETILTTIGQISLHAWSEASDVPPVSRHSFIMAQLARTRNFLAAIPDEVYNLVFAALTDSINRGDSLHQSAAAVEKVFDYTGSDYWPGRAANIAQTETTRAYGVGTLAAGLEQQRVTGRKLSKRWDDNHDHRVRPSHRAVSGDIKPLGVPFLVGGFPMQCPGDESAPADEVCGCRCRLAIVNGEAR